MRILIFIFSCLIVAGVLALSGCSTPVYVDKKVLVPVKCKVTPIALHPLAVNTLPDNATTKEILEAMYSDQVLMAGELRAMETELKGCE